MDRFPETIARSMRATGSEATCVPVRLSESGDWEAALFVHVSGPECKQDRRLLKRARTPTPAELSPQLLAHKAAAVVSLELSVATVPDDPLKYEILLVPGREETHFQAIKLLGRQQRICWFFGDNDFRLIQSQEHELSEERHALFESLARDTFAHDSLLRMSNQYDSDQALSEIAGHYAPRTNAGSRLSH